MTKAQAEKIFKDYVSKTYKNPAILSIDERQDDFLFEFKESADDFPIDYPIIRVMRNGRVQELSFLKDKDRAIIMGMRGKNEG